MRQGHFSQDWTDDADNPAGGVASGRGFAISWQNGPLGTGDLRREPNGAFVEDVLEAVVDRMLFYQEASGGRFQCEENAQALFHIRRALAWLDSRTKNREKQGVEGLHEAHVPDAGARPFPLVTLDQQQEEARRAADRRVRGALHQGELPDRDRPRTTADVVATLFERVSNLERIEARVEHCEALATRHARLIDELKGKLTPDGLEPCNIEQVRAAIQIVVEELRGELSAINAKLAGS